MFKKVFVAKEVIEDLTKGKSIQGALRRDVSGKLVFKVYARKRTWKKKPDKVLCQLPNGWLKESAQRIKFFTSQKKEMKPMQICNGMQRELDEAKSVIMHNAEFANSNGKEVKG